MGKILTIVGIATPECSNPIWEPSLGLVAHSWQYFLNGVKSHFEGGTEY